MVTKGLCQSLNTLYPMIYLMQYDANGDDIISFRFQFYRQHSDGNKRSAIYLKLDEVPENMKS